MLYRDLLVSIIYGTYLLNWKSDIVHSCMKSINNLVKTVLELCGPQTLVLMCYEDRDIGDKPELQKRFNQVSLLKNTIEYCINV